MIHIKYKPLFDIEILHGFYRSGKCPDFFLVPTKACQTQLNTFGLLHLPTAFGCQVYAKVNTVGGNELIKSPLLEGSKFSFFMMLKRRDFENFSELNTIKPRSSHYYFNNLVNNLSTDSFPLLVANNSGKVVSDTDLIPFNSNTFAYIQEGTATVQNSELRFIDSGEEFYQTVNNHNNVFNFSYDLKKTPGGRAKFFIEEVEKTEIYVQPTKDLLNTFGIVEIFYKSSLVPEYQFLKNDHSIETKFYKIAFANMATRWRYIISKKFDKTITGVTVGKTNGNPIAFTAQPNSPTDQFIIASNEPVPLQEGPVTGIQLRDQTDKVLIPHLPNPPLMLVKTEGSDSFSDILITI
ncbi:MAG: hypothetical protein WD426_12655 [Anditalea sp.]